MSKSPANHETIQNIQILRGVSALLVVLFHLGPIYNAIGVPQFGGGGVDVFFVISGFIMAHTCAGRQVSALSFFRNRLRRIAPLYWTMTSFVFCLALIAPGLMKSAHTSWSEFVKSLFFISFERDGALADPILFLGWTLNYEMFFYLIFALGLATPGVSGAGFSMFAIISLVAMGRLLDLQSPLARFYTDPIMLEFCLGMALAGLHAHIPAKVPGSVRYLFLGVATLALALVILVPVFWRDVGRAYLSGSAAFALVGVAVALDRWRMQVHSKLFMALGASSYSLYLTHIFVTELLVKIFGKLQPNVPGALLGVFVGVVMSCWLGLLVYRSLEAPFNRFFRNIGTWTDARRRLDHV